MERLLQLVCLLEIRNSVLKPTQSVKDTAVEDEKVHIIKDRRFLIKPSG